MGFETLLCDLIGETDHHITMIMIIVITLIITTVMIITMVIRELLRFSCGEVAPSGGVKGIGTVALLSNSLPSMLVMIMMMMVVMVMMVVLVEYHDQNKMLSLEPYHFSNTLAKCQISHSRIDWGLQDFC